MKRKPEDRPSFLDALEEHSVGSYLVIGLKGGPPMAGAKLTEVLSDGIFVRSDDGGKLFLPREIIAFVHDTGSIKVVREMPPQGPQLVTQ